MKYKNQLIIGSSILVIVLAVFLGSKLIGNVNQDDNTLGNGIINSEIDDIADDGILDGDNVDDNEVDQDKNIENTNKESKENEKTEKTNEEKDNTSMLDGKENTDETNKDIDNEEKTEDTDKKENETDETNKETDDKNEINDEKTSKTIDEDGNIKDETRESEKELEQSKGKNVVYVFKNEYIVQQKETLSDITKKCLIANKLDVTNNIYFDYAKKLISKVNDIADPNLIITGTKMLIPTKVNFEGLIPEGEAYTIKVGDTIDDIVRNEMSWCTDYFKAKEMLLKHNNIADENAIQAGITIYIPNEDGEV